VGARRAGPARQVQHNNVTNVNSLVSELVR
jgi:hypothetical protein